MFLLIIIFDMQKIDSFLKTQSQRQKIIIIYWPTASGKTAFSLNIAKYLNSEIISVDSRQIYKYLDIWTGKIKKEEMSWITHHMIDIITPDMNYSVWEFKNNTTQIIQKLHNNWKIPVLVWWTWLYLDSIIYDFDIPKVIWDIKLRKSLEEEALKYWKKYVYDKLVELDSEYAKTIHPNNLNYIIRAIEVKILSGKSKLDFKKEKTLKYNTLFLTPYNWDREKLYNKINLRINEMFQNWLIEEVQNILNMWYKKESPWLQTIWYKEVISYLDWEITLEDCISLVSQNNRNYAKRQLTWIGDKYKNSFDF